MNVQLHIKDKAGRCIFAVEFANDEEEPVLIPVDAVRRSGERLGLTFCLDGAEVLPVEFGITNPRRLPADILLPPGNVHTVEFEGRLIEKLPGVFALVFANATYKVEPRKTYAVQFSWWPWTSNSVKWCANAIE